jgi:hypothetical protein
MYVREVTMKMNSTTKPPCADFAVKGKKTKLLVSLLSHTGT